MRRSIIVILVLLALVASVGCATTSGTASSNIPPGTLPPDPNDAVNAVQTGGKLFQTQLAAVVAFTGTQFTIFNAGEGAWTNITMRVNSSFFAHGYWLKTDRMDSGGNYSVGIMQFAKDDETKLDPNAIKPRTFTIQADTPEGKESWSGKWN